MISLLAKRFIKNYTNTAIPSVRRAYGPLCGILGIILNVLLVSLDRVSHLNL